MTREPLRVVFDTMVYLQAVGTGRGPAFAALQRFEAGDFRLFVDTETVNEVQDVLLRPEIRRKMPLLTDERVLALIERLERKATFVMDVRRRAELSRDRDDEPVLNLALEAEAHYLATRDNDLLDLMDENTPDGSAFRRRFPHLTIIEPAAFLRELFQS
jgi:putative PIN family toxin of toxin-antitoxin system